MRRILSLSVALLAVSTLAAAQTADELIAKNIQAKGGLEKVKAIQTLRSRGRFVQGGFSAEVGQESKRPGKVRETFTIQGMTQVQAYDGHAGWQVSPFEGRKDPELLGEDDLRDLEFDADLDGPLVDYGSKGNTVEYVGHDTVDGDDVFRLKCTLKNGDVVYYDLDPDTFLEVRVERQQYIRGALRERQTDLGAYKPVAGVMFPFSLETGPKDRPGARARITVESIEANVPLDDARFGMPAAGQASPALAPPAAAPAAPGAPAAVPAPLATGPVKFDAGTISGLPARNVGSAAMSGRVAAVAAVPENGRLTVYVGAASGGVWKSINGGTTFQPVFDKQDVQSIGAVATDPSHPKTVWVGTGESWARNSVSVGDGVYKSTDGGETWTNVGLKDSERVAKILVDPSEGDTVYVCATGHLWNDDDERGVYKTTDGGKTWRKVLAGANASTGCGMLAMSAQDPKTLFASTWDFRRQGWTFRSGGPGSGLFKSTDGGEHWTELLAANSKGLPEKPYGRIAVAIAPGKPQVVYAMIESKKSALFRSDDGGASWKRVDASQYMVWRPFYFANLVVDPKDENKLFKPDGPLLVSTDGGKSFSSTANAAHGDFHDLWIDPANPSFVLAGDDGGFWRSTDGGSRWEHLMNLPISQFYHVSLDLADPYRVYGGLQDNSSWVGDSSYPGGVTNSRWENMYGGDGFWTWEDPADPAYVYAEAQGGEIGRVNRFTHEARSIKPYAQYGEKKLRFNWNTPIQMSPNEKGTIYIGAQYLFRSRDHGQSWDRISPDLTTNDPEKQRQEESGGVTVDNSAAEMHTTIYSISESPRNGQVLWVGTDDGNVQVTRDGGKTWTNAGANVAGVGKNPWVSWVEASRFDEGTAYAAFDRHTYGDTKPYVYRTADFGRTWTALPVEESGVRGYAHVIREDTKDPRLLFLGTEFGLWISADGGHRWAQYQGAGFPAVAVRDLVVHPRESDLVLATHGRGIWIIDDISPLRALTPELMEKTAAFVAGRPAVQYMNTFGGWPEGDASFHGSSRPGEAQVTYYQRGRHIFGDLKIEILDPEGKVVDTIAGGKHRGLNRASWSMRLKAPKVPPAASALFGAAFGPRVVPGTYTVRMTKGGQVYTAPLEVALDPRATYTVEDRKAQVALVSRIGGMLNHMSWAVDAIIGVRDQANARAAKLGAKDALAKRLTSLALSADAIRAKIVATKEGGAITGEERLREYLGGLYGDVNGYDGRPTASQAARADALSRELEDVIRELTQLTDKQLPALNRDLAGKHLDPVRLTPETEWRETSAADASPGAAVPVGAQPILLQTGSRP